MFAHINGYDDKLEKLEKKLGKKNKEQLIEMGRQYGFDFKHSRASKADMVVELADVVLREEREEK